MADDSKSVVADEKTESGWAAAEEPAADAGGEAEDSESPQKNLSRPSAEDIYNQVAKNAKEELKRSTLSLAISGFTGGVFMGLSALGVGLILAVMGGSPGAFVISRMC
jgi:hypothetical protein